MNGHRRYAHHYLDGRSFNALRSIDVLKELYYFFFSLNFTIMNGWPVCISANDTYCTVW